MSQLTEQQIKALHDAANEYKTGIDMIINLAQKKLVPPPSYGEISFRAYNACFPLDGSMSWGGISERARNAEEAGAQAVIEEAKKRGEFKEPALDLGPTIKLLSSYAERTEDFRISALCNSEIKRLKGEK